MSKSIMEQVAALPPAQRAEILEGLDAEALANDWSLWGRPEQFPPPGDWGLWAIVSGRGFGKALWSETPIATPTGWTPIGELAVGDYVFAHDGTPTKVTSVYVPDERETYKVTFRNGASLIAGRSHEWTVFRPKDKSRYITEVGSAVQSDWWKWKSAPATRGQNYVYPNETHVEFARALHETGKSWRAIERLAKEKFLDARPSELSRGRLKNAVEGAAHAPRTLHDNTKHVRTLETHELKRSYSIPATAPIQCPELDLPIDPYILGAWLGDGYKRDGSVCAHVDDAPKMIEHFKQRGYDDVKSVVRDYRPTVAGIWSKKLFQELKQQDLINNKHVPKIYLRSSIEQRWELVRGLMDTDGTCSNRGHGAGAGFVLENLTDSLEELVTSLGIIPWRTVKLLTKTPTKPVRPFFGVNWRPTPECNPFYLERKRDLVRPMPDAQSHRKTMHFIESVTQIEDHDLVCISVEHESRLFLAGRAMIPTHNTRTGAEWVREKAKQNPGCRIALVGRTVADVRMTMVQGESGLLAVCPPSELSSEDYKPSNRRIIFPNGTICETFSSESPSQLRGPQFHYAWADEVAAYGFIPDDSGLTAWDNLALATRLGDNPQIVATTTPKRTPFMEDLAKEQEAGRAVITRGSTYDNASNLSGIYLQRITGQYEGTRLAQQELMGMLLDKVEGALWEQELIQNSRVQNVTTLPLRIVAVDPSVAENPRDECGIVVVGATKHRQLHLRHAYVLEDASVHGSPEVWAKRVVETARKWNAPIVAETNQGGALVRMALQSMDTSGIRIMTVHASKGKQARAEPVVLPYEQGRVHHVGYFPDLEAQLTGWVPEETRDSPDRLDALVYGVTALLLEPPRGFSNAPLRAYSAARTQMPMNRGSGLAQAYTRKS